MYNVFIMTASNRPYVGWNRGGCEYIMEVKHNILLQVRQGHGPIIAYKESLRGDDWTDYTFLVYCDVGPFEEYEPARLYYELL